MGLEINREQLDSQITVPGYDSYEVVMQLFEIDAIQKSLISRVDLASTKTQYGDRLFTEDCKEVGLKLMSYKSKGHFFLGVQAGEYREYISCSKTPKDINYTHECITNNSERVFYSYTKNPEVVISNSLRVLSIFREFSEIKQ
mgnify:CR=1 FL=1